MARRMANPRNCAFCGVEFCPWNGKQKFCSQKCDKTSRLGKKIGNRRDPRPDKSARFELKTPTHRKWAVGKYKRMADVLTTISMGCEVLQKIDVGMVVQVCPPDEIAEWLRMSNEAGKGLAGFVKMLKGAVRECEPKVSSENQELRC